MSWCLSRALEPVDRWSWRLTGGRGFASAWLSGLPVILLTTRGARSGEARTAPVLGIRDGDALVVIGSNYGRDRSPGWAFNLRAEPAARVRVEGRERGMVARELTGAEHDAAYARAAGVYPAYLVYRRRAAPRVIPVFRLESAAS